MVHYDVLGDFSLMLGKPAFSGRSDLAQRATTAFSSRAPVGRSPGGNFSHALGLAPPHELDVRSLVGFPTDGGAIFRIQLPLSQG